MKKIGQKQVGILYHRKFAHENGKISVLAELGLVWTWKVFVCPSRPTHTTNKVVMDVHKKSWDHVSPKFHGL